MEVDGIDSMDKHILNSCTVSKKSGSICSRKTCVGGDALFPSLKAAGKLDNSNLLLSVQQVKPAEVKLFGTPR